MWDVESMIQINRQATDVKKALPNLQNSVRAAVCNLQYRDFACTRTQHPEQLHEQHGSEAIAWIMAAINFPTGLPTIAPTVAVKAMINHSHHSIPEPGTGGKSTHKSQFSDEDDDDDVAINQRSINPTIWLQIQAKRAMSTQI